LLAGSSVALLFWVTQQQKQNQRVIQPLAANFCALAAYSSRHFTEQKCTTPSPTWSGMARSSAMCTPQTGSRTSRRELRADCCWALGTLCCPVSEFTNPRSIQTTARRNIATAQHSTTSQIKNRIVRKENSRCLLTSCCHRMQGEKAESNEILWFQQFASRRIRARRWDRLISLCVSIR
jgi:hypothetical protein